MKGKIQVLEPNYNKISLLTSDNDEIILDYSSISNNKFFHNDNIIYLLVLFIICFLQIPL